MDDNKPQTGEMIPQKHGGALRYGGTNRGGPGRPPNEIRNKMRVLGYRMLEEYEKQYDKGALTEDQKEALFERCMKYGLGTKQDIDLHVDDARELSDAELDAEIAALEGRKAAEAAEPAEANPS